MFYLEFDKKNRKLRHLANISRAGIAWQPNYGYWKFRCFGELGVSIAIFLKFK